MIALSIKPNPIRDKISLIDRLRNPRSHPTRR